MISWPEPSVWLMDEMTELSTGGERSLHPLMSTKLFGHDDSEQEILSAILDNRLPHAWLICGARGIGKATLAWRAVKFLFMHHQHRQDGVAPTSLETPGDHPVVRGVKARTETTVMCIGHAPDADKGLITVDEVRRLKSLSGLTAADDKPLAAVIDSADDLNPSSANVLLKLLEEPQDNSVFFLVCNNPARLLPTIRANSDAIIAAPGTSCRAQIHDAGFAAQHPVEIVLDALTH